MANSVNTKFRASYGLDAANQKVINVATADRTVLTDGVNVDYFIKENTIQKYDPTRSYLKDFSVLYNNRLWTAKLNTPNPAGPFNVGYWQPLREDPKWISVNEGTRQIQSGDYITVNTQEGKAVTLTLPSSPDDGDTVTIKDVGGRPGFIDVLIKAPIQSILDRGVQVQQVLLTIPFAELVFVYNNSLWNLFTNIQADLGKTINSSNVGETDVQAGESVIRNYNANKEIVVRFPKNANNGDMIHFVGMDATDPALYHLIANTYDNTTSIGTVGTTTYETRHAVNGYFVYDAPTKLWTLYDSDTRTRLRVISTDTTLYPNDAVAVTGKASNNTTASIVNLTLPTNIAIGDTVEINLMYLRLKQTVNIKPATGDLILASTQFLQYPKSSEYPATVDPWVTMPQITYDGTSSYLPVITLSYYEEVVAGVTKKYWIVRDNNILTERVNALNDTTRQRLGVISLANTTTSKVESTATMTIAHTETAITPELLAKRLSTTTQTGIARLANEAEVTGLSSDGAWVTNAIVTPFTLDKKKAREDMRGLAEIATQAEANTMGASADDERFITARKLDARRATTTQSGIVLTVANGGVAPVAGPTVTRDTAGTLIYNFNDKANVVTPSTLREYISTELALGGVYLATDAEVRGGTAAADGKHPIVVTPSALEKKIATDTLIGFTQVATQAEVNTGTDYFKYVTPKTFNDRVATGAMTGIAKLATQAEFDAGDANYISDPSKIKTFFLRSARTSVTAAAGLTQTGNLWDGITFNIVAPTTAQRGTTRLATSAEVNAGTDNTTIVTPLTLHGKKSTTTTEGIIRVANTQETIDGLSANTAVCPLNLKTVIQTTPSWQGTSTTRGTVKLSIDATTWQGDTTNGNKNINLSVFPVDGMAVSPYEFNKTLRNYLPLNATADNAVKFNGLVDTQFIRRDIAQTVDGALTFKSDAVFEKKIDVTGNITSQGNVVSKTGLYVSKALINDNNGIYLYGVDQKLTDPNSSYGRPMYGMYFSRIGDDRNGAYGDVTTNYAIYNTISLSSVGEKRGWIFQSIYNETNTNVASISAQGVATFNSNINTINGTLQIKGRDVASIDASNNLIFGTPTQQMYLRSPDASDIRVQEAVGGTVYKVITTQNFVTEGNKSYVRKDGDTVTGRLNMTSPITFTLPEANIPAGIAGPSATNFGSWVCNITNATLIAGFPGYLVGILDTNNETGQPTGYYKEYQEFKGQGTLTQFGSSASNGAGTYQIWAPRPTVTTDQHMASTYYLRHWNPVAVKWDGWSRLYTSSNPPLHSEIGAISNNDTTFDSLKIRTWFQIDHVKMWADPVSKSVKFEWVD